MLSFATFSQERCKCQISAPFVIIDRGDFRKQRKLPPNLISSHDVTTMTATAKDIMSVIVDARIFVVMTNVWIENFVVG